MAKTINDRYLATLGGEPVKQGPLDKAAEQWAMNVWTNDDSRSLIRLAPECVQRAMAALPDDLRSKDEASLRAMYSQTSKKKLTPMDNQVRLAFWLEYERVQREMAPKMIIGNVLRGIMAYDYFTGNYLKDEYRVAYLTIPPISYTVRLNEMLDTGLDQIRNVMDMPHVEYDNKGRAKVNTKLLELKFKIMTYVDMRKNGAIAQKLQIEQKSLNMNMKGDARDILDAVEGKNMADLDKRLASLRQKQLMIERGVHPDRLDATDIKAVIEAEKVEEGTKDGERPESGES